MLEQMAEALDDEAACLYRRAAVYEEEEFLLAREIEERQTEINRLMMKLDVLRADRDNTLERIDSLSGEAASLRDELYCNQEIEALAALDCYAAGGFVADPSAGRDSSTSLFFRRLRPADVAR